MKRFAAVVVAVAVTVAGLWGLAELTQNRPDPIEEGSSTELVVSVRTREGAGLVRHAERLWAVCSGTARGIHQVGDIVEEGDGLFQLTLSPALGEHTRRRLVGCLEDFTLDGLKGSVKSVDYIAPA